MNPSQRILLLVLLLTPALAVADITVEIGPTSIPRGDAIAERDITVNNGIFAVAFAVDTAPPWGVARGGIVDIAIVGEGGVGYDIASLADFMPNRWSAWPTSYQDVSISKSTANEVVIKTARDWGDVELVTMFHIKDEDSKIRVLTTMTNSGDAMLEDLFTGYVSWSDGGSLVGSPGLDSVLHNIAEKSLRQWSAAYDENWLIGLHAPFATFAAYGGRDRYVKHDLGPGKSRAFEAWFQIEDSGSLAPMVQSEIEIHNLDSGVIRGNVRTNNGSPVDRPALIVSRDGRDYAWAIGQNGKYSFVLPAGEYEVYATAKEHSQGKARAIVVGKSTEEREDFSDVEPPGTARFRIVDAVRDTPIDARIDIVSGPTPPIGYFGKSALFTDLESIGSVEVNIAPGVYEFEVSAGGGFVSVPQVLERQVLPGKATIIELSIATIATPQNLGWYSADLHHHSDVADGFSDPVFVMQSELAAGLDITFLSDHDSVHNNARMRELSAARDVLFIPGTEMSPSWAHFNAFPLDDGKTIEIDSRKSTVQEIFAAARDMGADVIEVNHPYMPYGYFRTQEAGELPGGYDAGFELVEIEASIHGDYAERNQKTVDRIWRLWNEGLRVYLAAGSDSHDVWLQPSGAARTFVYVEGEVTIEKFVQSLKAGRAFASQGPLIYPEIMFGSDIKVRSGADLSLNFSVQAVSGLKGVKLIASGFEVGNAAFDGEPGQVPVRFSETPDSDRWYSVVVEDMNGQFAYSNPIWVTVTD